MEYTTNINLKKGVEIMQDNKEIELIKSIIQTKSDLRLANKNFESAEAELIDYYAYQIKANKAKLDYLIKKVKQNGIVLDMVEAIELRVI